MRSPFRFSMNIRQKVIVGLTLMLVIVSTLGTLSYHHLLAIERKQHFVEEADDLSNTILEIRRYEKNYQLYGSSEDLSEYRKYVDQGMEILKRIAPEAQELKVGGPILLRIEQELLAYRDLMHRLTAESPGRQNSTEPVLDTENLHPEDQLREKGKALVDLSRQLVSFERQRILTIIGDLKLQLLTSLGVFLVMGSLLIPFVAQKIIRPLRVIEQSTLRIGAGNFRPLPVLETHDETQRVIEAFNRMIAELERGQDQLLQAKKLSSLGTLTSGVAHQLNNPLNNISTSCQILIEELDQADPDFVRKMLVNVEQEVRRARDIVRSLLEFSRMREFCVAPTPLSDVVDRSVSLISSHIPPGIEVVKDVPPGLSLNIDGQRMQQVFLNLIENAIHAMEKRPGKITISARLPEGDNRILISVEDSGRGISGSHIGRVFDPFFTTKEVGMGTGLGLSIVYGIVEKHGGSISVESTEGQGTRFNIHLPSETLCERV
jgi:two-component system, NtrC family, sensor kinase